MILKKKPVFMICGYSAVLIVLFAVFYLPEHSRITSLKNDLVSREEEIKYIKSIIGDTPAEAATIPQLEKKYAHLCAVFPESEEEAIRMVSAIANELNISIISLRIRPKEVFFDSDNKPLKIDSKTCQSVLLNLSLNCRFGDLVKYIERIRREIFAFSNFELISISKPRLESPEIDVAMSFSFYLLTL